MKSCPIWQKLGGYVKHYNHDTWWKDEGKRYFLIWCHFGTLAAILGHFPGPDKFFEVISLFSKHIAFRITKKIKNDKNWKSTKSNAFRNCQKWLKWSILDFLAPPFDKIKKLRPLCFLKLCDAKLFQKRYILIWGRKMWFSAILIPAEKSNFFHRPRRGKLL